MQKVEMQLGDLQVKNFPLLNNLRVLYTQK